MGRYVDGAIGKTRQIGSEYGGTRFVMALSSQEVEPPGTVQPAAAATGKGASLRSGLALAVKGGPEITRRVVEPRHKLL